MDDADVNLFNNEGSGVIDYNCWYNPSNPKEPEGEHGIAVDPKFVDPDNNDYRLQLDSPCLDAGEGGIYIGYTDETGEGNGEGNGEEEEIYNFKLFFRKKIELNGR